jgi:hypothetical protein
VGSLIESPGQCADAQNWIKAEIFAKVAGAYVRCYVMNWFESYSKDLKVIQSSYYYIYRYD